MPGESLYTQLILDEINQTSASKYGPYKYYILKISGELRFLPRVESKYMSYLNIIRELIRKYPRDEDIQQISSNYSFETLYDLLREEIKRELSAREDLMLNDNEVSELSLLVFWELVGLARIAPFLYPNSIEEVYCDGPGTRVYVKHEEYGTLDTDIHLMREELDALVTHIEMHKGTNIDLLKGNIESEIRTADFHTRVIIDLEALTYRGPYIIIRNLKSKKLTIIDLIRKNTITAEAAAFLILALWFRRNVTIAGEVYSGKTTLLNALDQCIPKDYRRVYIEDAFESRDLRGEGYKQAFYRGEAYSSMLDKRRQLIFTLHRTPDILILGELLTNNDIETFFYSLSCGLRGLQTIHAEDIYSLLNRWLFQAEIDERLLGELDIIVTMKRDVFGKRFVTGIYEIDYTKDGILLRPIYLREGKGLMQVTDLHETKIFKMITNEVGQRLANRLYTHIKQALKGESIEQIMGELESIYRWLRWEAMEPYEHTNPNVL